MVRYILTKALPGCISVCGILSKCESWQKGETSQRAGIMPYTRIQLAEEYYAKAQT
jgi:hypothetical protein